MRRHTEPRDSSWVAAIYTDPADGAAPAGVGVVLDDRRILTCAHVFDAGAPVWVGFPRAGVRNKLRRPARLEWAPENGDDDVAVLRLEERVPTQVRPAPIDLRAAPELRDEPWWAFGHPQDNPAGSTAYGTVEDQLRWGWVRLVTTSEYGVEQGFSGGGLWIEGHGVAGLVGLAESGTANGGNAAALTSAAIAGIMRESATARASGLRLATAPDAIDAQGHRVSRRSIRHKTMVALGVAVGVLAIVLGLLLQPDDDDRTDEPKAAVSLPAGSEPSRPAADALCSEQVLLAVGSIGQPGPQPPKIYGSSCTLYSDEGAQAALRLDLADAPGAVAVTIRRRVELRRCGWSDPEAVNPPDPRPSRWYDQVTEHLTPGAATYLAGRRQPTPFAAEPEGKLSGSGRLVMTEIVMPDDSRWYSEERALGESPCSD
ncbi:S1 family peptidase [Symbioplanes lichenis]|uniref:S1 family peptidase n=1 Tax=Symbioplanes lichenis TaxID=1629072 RepID=UPI0027391F55|nr:serine protease [Actinoplanes lichenis]